MGNQFYAHIFKQRNVGEREEVKIKLFNADGTPADLSGSGGGGGGGGMQWLGDYDSELEYAPGSVVRGDNKSWVVVGPDSMPAGGGAGADPGEYAFRGIPAMAIDAFGNYNQVVDGSTPTTSLHSSRAAQRVAVAVIRVGTEGTLSLAAEHGDSEFALFTSGDTTTPIMNSDDVWGGSAGLNGYTMTAGLYFLVASQHSEGADPNGTWVWKVGPTSNGPSTAVLIDVAPEDTPDAHWELVS